MLILVIALYILLIFPIYLNGYLYFSLDVKKLFFSIKLFKAIKLFSGYAELRKEGIFIHLTRKKAILIPYSSLTSMKKKVKPLKDYHIIKWEFEADLGMENNTLFALETAFFINYFTSFINWLTSNIKPYLIIKNNVNVYDSKNVLRLYFYGTVLLNSLMILLSLVKILLEKIIYALSNGKEQNN